MTINQLAVGSVTLKTDTTVVNSGYSLKDINGLETPMRRIPFFQLPNQDGAFISNTLYGERVVAFSVQIFGSSESDYIDNKKALFKEFDLNDKTRKEVTLTDASGDTYFISCEATLIQKIEERRAFGNFRFVLMAETSAIEGGTEKSEIVKLRDTSGGLTIPTAVPASFGTASGGTVTCTNGGDMDAYPVFKLQGPLTNPTIANITTGKSIKYSSTIAAGDYILINTKPGNRTVIDQDGYNKLKNLSTNIRDFFPLISGDNDIQFSHEGAYSSTPSAIITWRDAYSGI